MTAHVIRRIAIAPHAGPERFVVTSWSPRPAGTAGDGQVVIMEGEDGTDQSNQVSKYNVKGVVPVIPPTRTSNVDRSKERNDGNGEEVQRRSRSLSPRRCNLLILLGDSLACHPKLGGRRCQAGLGAVGELIRIGAADFHAWDASPGWESSIGRRRVRLTRCIGKERNRDSEFARNEEGEVDEAWN